MYTWFSEARTNTDIWKHQINQIRYLCDYKELISKCLGIWTTRIIIHSYTYKIPHWGQSFYIATSTLQVMFLELAVWLFLSVQGYWSVVTNSWNQCCGTQLTQAYNVSSSLKDEALVCMHFMSTFICVRANKWNTVV